MCTDFSRVASASHASLGLIQHEERSNESLTAFIYRWGELLTQSCKTSAEQGRSRLIVDLFSLLL